MLRTIKSYHVKPIIRPLRVYVDSTGPAVDVGGQEIASTTGGAGTATIAPILPFARTSGIVCQAGDSLTGGYGHCAAGTSSFVVSGKDSSGAAASGTVLALAYGYLSPETDVVVAQTLKNHARSPRLIPIKVVSGAVVQGKSSVDVSVATGTYDLTYKPAFGREAIVVATPISTTQKSLGVTNTTAVGCTITAYDSSEAEEANDFCALICGWDTNDEQGGYGSAAETQAPVIKPRSEMCIIASNGGVTVGTGDVTVVRNGTGDYTVTFVRSYLTAPVCVASCIATGRAQFKTAPTTTAVNVVTFNAAGSAADVGFTLIAVGSDSTFGEV